MDVWSVLLVMRRALPTTSNWLAPLIAVGVLAGVAGAELVSVRGDEDPRGGAAWAAAASGTGGGAVGSRGISPWSFELVQSAWNPLPSTGVARAAVAEARSVQWGRTLVAQQAWQSWDVSAPMVALWAYDIDATAWWDQRLGAFVSGRVVDDAALAGVQALVADLGGAWRIAASPSGTIDFVAGARVAATASSAQNAGADGIAAESLASWTALEGEGAPLAGFRSRAEVARGVELSLRGDLSPNIDGGGVAWRVGGGVRVKLGAPRGRDAWDLSVEAGWRTLDAALLRGLPGAGSAGDDQVGAVWVGFSREF